MPACTPYLRASYEQLEISEFDDGPDEWHTATGLPRNEGLAWIATVAKKLSMSMWNTTRCRPFVGGRGGVTSRAFVSKTSCQISSFFPPRNANRDVLPYVAKKSGSVAVVRWAMAPACRPVICERFPVANRALETNGRVRALRPASPAPRQFVSGRFVTGGVLFIGFGALGVCLCVIL